VFGVGNPAAQLCFLGEAPGADEDRIGEPFVGAAVQLLNKILTASQLTREEVYILNVVKCRPPSNRTPTEQEMANCFGFARRQLEIIRPQFICCLGAVAVQALLGVRKSISSLRQQWHTFGSSRVVVTYHPAYLLRNPAAKRDVWQDMIFLRRGMGVDLSAADPAAR
jgi:DNA polymerase